MTHTMLVLLHIYRDIQLMVAGGFLKNSNHLGLTFGPPPNTFFGFQLGPQNVAVLAPCYTQCMHNRMHNNSVLLRFTLVHSKICFGMGGGGAAPLPTHK